MMRLGAGLSLLCAIFIVWQAGLPKDASFEIDIREDELIEAPLVGGLVPSVESETLSGQTISLNAQLGHPLIINFWATWCGPCIEEMPLLDGLFQTGIPVVGINTGLEQPTDVQRWVNQFGLSFPIIMDDNTRRFERLYRVQGLPATFFVDANGFIRYIIRGPLDDDTLRDGLAAIGIE